MGGSLGLPTPYPEQLALFDQEQMGLSPGAMISSDDQEKKSCGATPHSCQGGLSHWAGRGSHCLLLEKQSVGQFQEEEEDTCLKPNATILHACTDMQRPCQGYHISLRM